MSSGSGAGGGASGASKGGGYWTRDHAPGGMISTKLVARGMDHTAPSANPPLLRLDETQRRPPGARGKENAKEPAGGAARRSAQQDYINSLQQRIYVLELENQMLRQGAAERPEPRQERPKPRTLHQETLPDIEASDDSPSFRKCREDLAACRAQIESLQSELAHAHENHRAETEKSVHDLHETNQVREAHEAKLAVAASDKESLTSQVARMAEEIAALQGELRAGATREKDLRDLVKVRDAQVEVLTAEVGKLEVAYRCPKCYAKEADLLKKLEAAEGWIEAHTKRTEHLQRCMEELRKDLVSAKQSYDALGGKLNAERIAVARLEGEKEAVEARLRDKMQALDATGADLQALQTRFADLAKTKDALQAVVSTCEQRERDADGKVASARAAQSVAEAHAHEQGLAKADAMQQGELLRREAVRLTQQLEVRFKQLSQLGATNQKLRETVVEACRETEQIHAIETQQLEKLENLRSTRRGVWLAATSAEMQWGEQIVPNPVEGPQLDP